MALVNPQWPGIIQEFRLCSPTIVVSICIVRPEFDGLVVVSNGSGDVIKFPLRKASIIVGLRTSRVQLDCSGVRRKIASLYSPARQQYRLVEPLRGNLGCLFR